MQIEALLCEAATVREGLLHILGGGITRIQRPGFPSLLQLDLALVFTLTPSEAQERHRLRVVVQTADGAKLADARAEFGVTASVDLQPGERIASSLALQLRQVEIPAAGVYGVEVLIDGASRRSFTLVASQATSQPSPTPT